MRVCKRKHVKGMIQKKKNTLPSKSPSLISDILFSWSSNFFSVSRIESDFCGIEVRPLPPRFNLFSFLYEKEKLCLDI